MYKFNYPLFRKYLLLYLGAAVIPALITVSGVVFSFNALKEEVIASNLSSLELIQTSMDMKLSEAKSLCKQMETDPELTNYALKSEPYSISSVLKKNVVSHDFIKNIIIMQKESNYYFSNRGGFSQEDLKNQFFIQHLNRFGHTAEEWTDMISSLKQPTYWPVNSDGELPNYMFYFYPMNKTYQLDSQASSCTAILLISQRSIQNLFHSSQTYKEESILLLNSDLDLLSALTSQQTTIVTQICDYLKTQSTLNAVNKIELEGTKYLLFVSHSQESNLNYARFLPESSAYQSIEPIRNAIIVIMILVLLAGIVVVWIGVQRSYIPIRSLADWVRSEQVFDNDTKNELTFFQQAFCNIMDKNSSLTESVHDSKQGLINHFLLTLIRGNFTTEEAFQNVCHNLGIELDKKYFLVCTIEIEQPEQVTQLPNFDDIIKTVRDNTTDNLQVQIKDLLFTNHLLFVLSGDSDDINFYHSYIRDIQELLLIHNNLQTSIGIGSICNSYEQIGRSYLDSSNALDYRLIFGKNSIIVYDMCSENNITTNYPSADLELLQTSIESHNIELAETAIENLISYIKSQNCTLHTTKYICYDAFSIIKKKLHTANIGYSSALSETLNITNLTDFDTIDEFFASYTDIVKEIMNPTMLNRKHGKTDMAQQLLEYIHTHCFSYEFQLNTMADYFNISPQYMRKIFKNYTNMSMSEYIANLKLEKAKQLLRETDMNLNDIVTAIGNTDVSGFIRYFKKNTRITPGQYRKSFER